MEEKKISVVMNAYNEREEWLRASIESILGQTYRNIEFIIVLDAPENAALETVIREYAAKDDRIVFLISPPDDRGRVPALNRALSAATGELIAIMDADDIAHADRLEKQLAALERSGCAIVAARTALIDEEGQSVGLSPCYGRTPETCRKSLKYRNVLPHPTWLVRKEVYDAVGPYHDIPSAEDCEWLCRAVSEGHDAIDIDEPLLDYRLRGTGISLRNIYRQWTTAATIRREYRRALSAGRRMSLPALEARLARIDPSRAAAFEKSYTLYNRGLARLKERRPGGLWDILRATLISPLSLRHSLDTLSLDRVNRV